MGGTSVCRMSKLASIKYASIDMQTCVVVLKRTASMRGFFRAPQHMLTRMRLEKRQLKMLFAHVVCYTHLLALLTDNSYIELHCLTKYQRATRVDDLL